MHSDVSRIQIASAWLLHTVTIGSLPCCALGLKRKDPSRSLDPFTEAQCTTRRGTNSPASSAGLPCSQTPCRTRRSFAPCPLHATRLCYADPSSLTPAHSALSGSGTTLVRS